MWKRGIGIALVVTLTACGSGSQEPGAAKNVADLKQIREEGVLRVATRNAPTTWYIDRFGEPTGLEYDRASAFAESLGVQIEIVEATSTRDALDKVRSGAAHLAAAGITVTPERQAELGFSTPTMQVTEQVICNREGTRAKAKEDLAGMTITVAQATSYASSLASLQTTLPDLKIRTQDTTTESLLRQVWENKLGCTVADSHVFALNRRYFPTLVAEFDLSETRSLAWVTHPKAKSLLKTIDAWLDEPATKNLMASTEARYLAPAEVFDFVDMRAFTRRIDERYKKFDKHFVAAAEEYSVDATLLAAQGYQESQWDPQAKSPTGVRGIMMLTKPTAESLGVTDRLDPVQSIEGGSQYLAKMKTRFSDEVTEPDLTYLALAAYNIGRAHMHDAQKLARERGLSPYKWDDIKTVLPLLSDKAVYPNLKYGYARGHEPVRYVERIQNYQDVLVAHQDAEG